jgi:hypothetical protein
LTAFRLKSVRNNILARGQSNYWIFVLMRTLDDVLTTLSGSTTSFAAISDCARGEELAVATSKLGFFIGLGVALGLYPIVTLEKQLLNMIGILV